MALTVRSGYAADLGWNKRIYVESEGTMVDLTNSVGDAQINSEVETESYSVYGTPNDKTVSTSVSYPLVINTMYATTQADVFQTWLEASQTFFWAELVGVNNANGIFASKGTFTLASYGAEGVTIGAAPTDGLIEMGVTPVPQGDSFEGKAYPFQATAAGALNLVGTVDDVAADEQVWILIHEINGTSVSVVLGVGGTSASAVALDLTKADIYALPKHAADNAGALTVTLNPGAGIAPASPVTGYVLVGKSVVSTS